MRWLRIQNEMEYPSPEKAYFIDKPVPKIKSQILNLKFLNLKSFKVRHVPEDIGIDAGKRGLERADVRAARDAAELRGACERAQPLGNGLKRRAVQEQQTAAVVLWERVEAWFHSRSSLRAQNR